MHACTHIYVPNHTYKSLLHNRVTQICSLYTSESHVDLLLPIGHFRVESDHACWASSWGLGCVEQQRGSVQKYLGRGLMLQTNASSHLNKPLMSDMSGANMSKSASWCMSWSKLLRWWWKNGRKERSDHQVPAVGTACFLWRVVRFQREGRPQTMTSLKCRT